MTIIRSTFDWAGELYGRMFVDWLHIHFLIRTVLLLLMLWLVIFLAGQVFQYFVWPLVLMVYYHVIFRFWNFFFVETPHEWLYIRHHSKDSPNFSQGYLRLCDKVKRNRLTLNHAKYRGMVVKARRLALQLMVVCAVTATLWVSAFGLHQEYADVVLPLPDSVVGGAEIPGYVDVGVPGYDNGEYNGGVYYAYYAPGVSRPSEWVYGRILTLNEMGRDGARLRDGVGITGSVVIEILWGDQRLSYLGVYEHDPYVAGLYWIRVLAPSGAEGYISSALVDDDV